MGCLFTPPGARDAHTVGAKMVEMAAVLLAATF